MEIESPWLLEGDGRLQVNGVNVVPLVDAELNRRFPGRALRDAQTPEGLSAAWAALERTWQDTLARALAMPPGTLDASVADEWSFTQTLRHLVMATDTWLGKAILERTRPYHPAGLPNDDDSPAFGASDFSAEPPPLTEVLEARADRQAMVGHYIAHVTSRTSQRPGRTRTPPTTPRQCSRACAPSWKRNGSTTGTPCVTSTRSPKHDRHRASRLPGPPMRQSGPWSNAHDLCL